MVCINKCMYPVALRTVVEVASTCVLYYTVEATALI